MAFLTIPNPPSPTTWLLKMINSNFCWSNCSATTSFASSCIYKVLNILYLCMLWWFPLNQTRKALKPEINSEVEVNFYANHSNLQRKQVHCWESVSMSLPIFSRKSYGGSWFRPFLLCFVKKTVTLISLTQRIICPLSCNSANFRSPSLCFSTSLGGSPDCFSGRPFLFRTPDYQCLWLPLFYTFDLPSEALGKRTYLLYI